MALTWTSTADVTDRWIGGNMPATTAQITTFLGDAEDTALRVFPDLQARIDRDAGTDTSEGPSVPLARVRKVLARMVIRHIRNPEGVRSTQDGAGPFQKTKTYGGDEPGALYLTEEDYAELGGVREGRMFQVDGMPSGAGDPSALPGFQGWTTASDYEGT